MTTKRVILLVEDNPDDEALTLRALKKGRVKNEIIIARDGAEALDVLAANPSAPELIMLDLKLPKLMGIEVLKKIRSDEKYRYTPVVVLTSSREDRDLVECYDNGANSYIVKPVDIQKFTEAITQLEIYWLLLNETPHK